MLHERGLGNVNLLRRRNATVALKPPKQTERGQTMQQAIQALNALVEAREERARALDKFRAKLLEVVPEGLRTAVDALFDNHEDTVEDLEDAVAAAETVAKEEVMAYGDTVDIPQVKALVNKGRVTWDSKRLEGYAVANPAILEFRKTGNPFVTLRYK